MTSLPFNFFVLIFRQRVLSLEYQYPGYVTLVYVVLKNDEDVISPYDFNLLFCRWLMRILSF